MAPASKVLSDPDDRFRVKAVATFADGSTLDADLVVIAAGIIMYRADRRRARDIQRAVAENR